MEHIEMVEKLRERTGVSYEEAKNALEQADWDLLDAIVILEAAGKIEKGAGDYSTKREHSREDQQRRSQQFGNAMNRFGQQLANLIEKGNQINIDFLKAGQHCFSLPLTAFVLLLLLGFWVAVPLMIVGLFFGFQYKVSGNIPASDKVNSAMNKASEFAENLKHEVENAKNDKK